MASDNPITCLNLGSQHVTGAVFTAETGGGLTLEKLERSELAGDPADDAHRLAQMKGALAGIQGISGEKGQKPRYAIPSQPVFIRSVALPPLDEEQVEQIVEFEAQQQVPFAINESSWGFQLMGDEDDIEVEVLLAAIKSDEIDEFDDAVRSAGFKPGGAEVAPIALFNAYRFNYPDLNETALLIDVGARTTNLIYIENQKCFIRTVSVGGADLTKAISKEFGEGFDEAEQKKVSTGFVALGGAYADHEDPMIAGMSKVIRNALTRLHSEIMRTTGFYRSQQGGSAPTLALLCGATSTLPFMREFFAEKLNLPIDYFNAVRNVKLGSGVDTAAATSMAHCLGEVVGCALREVGPCPAELELVPEVVQAERRMHRRKPLLMLATLVAVCGFVASGFYYLRAADIAESNYDKLVDKADQLQDFDEKIEAQRNTLTEASSRMKPYSEAIFQRAIWVGLLQDLNGRMEQETLWITAFQPMIMGPEKKWTRVFSDGNTVGFSGSSQPGGDEMIGAFRVAGLYRESNGVVNNYLEALRESPYFELSDLDDTTVVERRDAKPGPDGVGRWSFILPLPEAAQIPYTK